ncbi:unnamed protein product [Prorocentrum cordatum]|uniref:Uncharacterized protein n=1 Tax=Prorocentrum cordatum TaxID=2364126 RepID=A0ABN9TG57_9DINO|nr:unnamed protein product [Polarella glacialis]
MAGSPALRRSCSDGCGNGGGGAAVALIVVLFVGALAEMSVELGGHAEGGGGAAVALIVVLFVGTQDYQLTASGPAAGAMLRLLGYNPMSAGFYRMEEILQEVGNFDAIAFAGTKNTVSSGECTLKRTIKGRLVHEAPYGKAPFSNNACGVAVVLPHREPTEIRGQKLECDEAEIETIDQQLRDISSRICKLRLLLDEATASFLAGVDVSAHRSRQYAVEIAPAANDRLKLSLAREVKSALYPRHDASAGMAAAGKAAGVKYNDHSAEWMKLEKGGHSVDHRLRGPPHTHGRSKQFAEGAPPDHVKLRDEMKEFFAKGITAQKLGRGIPYFRARVLKAMEGENAKAIISCHFHHDLIGLVFSRLLEAMMEFEGGVYPAGLYFLAMARAGAALLPSLLPDLPLDEMSKTREYGPSTDTFMGIPGAPTGRSLFIPRYVSTSAPVPPFSAPLGVSFPVALGALLFAVSWAAFWVTNSKPAKDDEGMYKTYIGGGELPPEGYTNPLDPRLSEDYKLEDDDAPAEGQKKALKKPASSAIV